MREFVRQNLGVTGRIGRRSYVLGFVVSKLIAIAPILAVGGMAELIEPGAMNRLGKSGSTLDYVVIPLLLLGVINFFVFWFWAHFALAAKRAHDFDVSGALSLTLLIPLVNLIMLFVFALVSGTEGPNRYGPTRDGWFGVSRHLQPWSPPLPANPQGLPNA